MSGLKPGPTPEAKACPQRLKLEGKSKGFLRGAEAPLPTAEAVGLTKHKSKGNNSSKGKNKGNSSNKSNSNDNSRFRCCAAE